MVWYIKNCLLLWTPWRSHRSHRQYNCTDGCRTRGWRWMVAGPEVARVIVEFEDFNMHPRNQEETRHHEETPSVQITFARDVHSFVAVIEELGNPFEEDIETVRNAKQIGQDQFEAFSKECIVDRTKSIEEAIHRNKLPLFAIKRGHKIPKGNQQVKSLKNDVALFARLYIGCQTRDGNLEEFFRHENQQCPPALSDVGRLYLGSKSDLLCALKAMLSLSLKRLLSLLLSSMER